jgi:hypothetical protein
MGLPAEKRSAALSLIEEECRNAELQESKYEQEYEEGQLHISRDHKNKKATVSKKPLT